MQQRLSICLNRDNQCQQMCTHNLLSSQSCTRRHLPVVGLKNAEFNFRTQRPLSNNRVVIWPTDEHLVHCQGDQIGRIFAYVMGESLICAVFWKLHREVTRIFGLLFPQFGQKCIGRFKKKLIWSPCSLCMLMELLSLHRGTKCLQWKKHPMPPKYLLKPKPYFVKFLHHMLLKK
jgi:hypothetical protein